MTSSSLSTDRLVADLVAAFDHDPQIATMAGADADADTARGVRLARRADERGLLDLAYRSIDSPYGALLLVASPVGLMRVAFALEDHDAVLTHLATTASPRLLHSAPRTDGAARQLEEYFAGQRYEFDLALDLQLAHGFRKEVVAYLANIRYGTTASYAAVARAVGYPAAVRAVGSACSHNPIPLVVPCHRVVRSDGSYGQYLGGPEVKAALLAMETTP
jgi:methylated-DNA-[protein]-cysteine S-methyltransferase